MCIKYVGRVKQSTNIGYYSHRHSKHLYQHCLPLPKKTKKTPQKPTHPKKTNSFLKIFCCLTRQDTRVSKALSISFAQLVAHSSSALMCSQNLCLLLTSSNYLTTVPALRSPSRAPSLCSVLSLYSSYFPQSQLQCQQQFTFYDKASCTFPSLAPFQSQVPPASAVYMATTVTTRVGVIYYLCHWFNVRP